MKSRIGPGDTCRSTLAFGVVSATGTVAPLRGYRWAPLAWAVGLPLAASTAYLRLAADRHYLTDVLVGGAVGTTVGALVPLLFHGRRRETIPVVVVPTTAGALVQWSQAW